MSEQQSMRTGSRGVVAGATGGAAGAVVMAGYAMVVSAVVKDTGLFTPLYHIASAFLAPQPMMTSMEAAAAGDSTHLAAGPALGGMVVHLATGVGAGAMFGAAMSRLRVSAAVTVGLGVLFGLLVMVANAWVGLPVVAELFGGGEPIADMPAMAGWGTFTVEHLLYGLVLGAVVAALLARRGAVERVPSRVA